MSSITLPYKGNTEEQSATILLSPAAVTAYSSPNTAILPLDGSLPGGRWLAAPIVVIVEHDLEEVVVSEPKFHIHASASTEEEAIMAFRRIFSSYLDILSSREATLGDHLRDQLQYLRSVIRSA